MQQELDFGVFATAAANHARRRSSPPQPDRDGLFDADGVTIIAGRRQCAVEVAGDLFVDIQFKETKIRVTAIAPGRWDAVAVLSACTRAHGNRAYEVDYATAKPTNPNGLDELRIAAIVAADGLRPFLSKRPSAATWAFRKVTDAWSSPKFGFREYPNGCHSLMRDYRVRRAMRALEDAGLVHIELGPRGGMATAKVTWLPRAYLAPAQLAPADEEALEMLA